MKMVTIPAGTAIVGTGDQQIKWLVAHTTWATKWVEKGLFAREQPQHKLYVDTFSIGVHPVVVEQYQTFVDSGGYEIERYWTKSGRLWLETNRVKKPAYWGDALWTGDSRLPVVGVSWYEAIAFCSWMGEVLGKACRLPTEVEWEKAARGGDGRIYPWGNGFDLQKCNIRDAGADHTLPAGSYSPVGDSSYGCQEMIGNISEWVSSQFAPYPYDSGDGRENIEGTVERVTRGGSWYSPDFRARASARGMNDPSFQDNDLGFRVVMDM